MKWLNRLEYKIGRDTGIPNLSVGLAGSQLIFFLMTLKDPDIAERLAFIPTRVWAGEWWRIITFVAEPATDNLLFLFFAMVLLFIFGSTLERTWGIFKFNFFLLIGWALTVAVGLLFSEPIPISGHYLITSIMLAFATMNPEFPIRFFFILSIPIKYLARCTWALYLLAAIVALFHEHYANVCIIAAASANVIIFFWSDIQSNLQLRRVKMKQRTRRLMTAAPVLDYFHKCTLCGRTDRSDPQLEFRYCEKCPGNKCYCMDHIANHVHG